MSQPGAREIDRMKTFLYSPIPTLVFPLLLALSGCGSNVDTVENPFNDDEEQTNSGPPARDEAVRAFETSVWQALKPENRCGQCHDSDGGQVAFVDDTDVNIAYDIALPLVNLEDPSSSLLVTKMAEGHNCWETFDSVCADIIENLISSWAGTGDNTTARQIVLTAPNTLTDPGSSKSYPASAFDNDPNSFAETVHPLLTEFCAECHYEQGSTSVQSPFFANPDDVESAYEAAKAKMNIDIPVNSRLVQRLLEGHNCWSDCNDDADDMQVAIELFASGIDVVEIDPEVITSKAMNLYDGIIASGGSRHEADQVALWEFKSGTGSTAFDTSGVDPAMNLNLVGDTEQISWLGSYGLNFNGGKAQATTESSKKLHDMIIKSSGEYSVEAWAIPANVTQENASIISYDAGSTQRNFNLSQNLYSYLFYNRSNESDASGEPYLSTEDAGEILQSSLQHVVAVYDPVNGRSLYVNGELVEVSDPIGNPTTLTDWNDTYAFVLGQSSANNNTWLGKLRMVSLHNRILTAEQIAQNFEAGVGEKYYLLFSIADRIGIPDSYIRFEVSQFDDYSYLFENPTFINLDAEWTPVSFSIQNLRIGLNGREAIAGQTFAMLDQQISASDYSAAEGQMLSSRGTVIAMEKGPADDEFFLTFEVLADQFYDYADIQPVVPAAPADGAAESKIGVRTFDEINATIASITQVPITNDNVNTVFQQYRQQLPTVETLEAFLASHQMAIAQLALTSCSERVEADKNYAVGDAQRVLFADVNFNENAETAFDSTAKRAAAIDPILDAVLASNLDSQPDKTEVSNLLGSTEQQTLTLKTGSSTYDSLIEQMLVCPESEDSECNLNTDIYTVARTSQIVKAVCAAVVGSGAMLLQ